MYLHEDTHQFRETVLSCADALGIAPDFVAKDYNIVLLLSEITKANPDVVFKGGTSLSKCHHAIDRFSEDVDLGLSADRRFNLRWGTMRAKVQVLNLLDTQYEVVKDYPMMGRNYRLAIIYEF